MVQTYTSFLTPVGNAPTRATIETYGSRFGDDYFSFWVGGVRFISLNTQLYSDPSGGPDLAEAQVGVVYTVLFWSNFASKRSMILTEPSLTLNLTLNLGRVVDQGDQQHKTLQARAHDRVLAHTPVYQRAR